MMMIVNVNPKRKLQLGHRIDTKNKRKKIDYATSETFLIELFDGICEELIEEYNAIAQVEKDVLPWIFIHQEDDAMPPPEDDEEKEYGKVYRTGQENEQLKRICYKIMDYHEDEIFEQLRGGYDIETLNLKEQYCWKKLMENGVSRCNNVKAGYPVTGKKEEWPQIRDLEKIKRYKSKKARKAKKKKGKKKKGEKKEKPMNIEL